MLEITLRLALDDNDTWLVTCEDFPEVSTYGETIEAALRNVFSAVEEAKAARKVKGRVANVIVRGNLEKLKRNLGI